MFLWYKNETKIKLFAQTIRIFPCVSFHVTLLDLGHFSNTLPSPILTRNSTNSKNTINASSMLGFRTKISNDDQKIHLLVRK